jgi:ketosteroid isomerase-like protein
MTAQPFDQFMKTREDAAAAYVRGDAAPLDKVVARASPASFFGPNGGHREGATEVAATYDQGAKAFHPTGESQLEILQSGESGDLAFWTGIQRAVVQMAGHHKPMPMDLRITEVFRREEGDWKLVHRHADTLVTEQPPKAH